MKWAGALAIGVLMFAAGCTAKPELKRDPNFEKWRIMAEKSRGHSPSARKRSLTLPPKTVEVVPQNAAPMAEVRQLPQRPTTIEMQDTEIAVLLRALARAVNQDIIINENVQGKVNINVTESPWDQVFRGVLRTHGLTYGWEGDIIHIITLEDKDKNLKQLETEQKIVEKQREMEMVGPLITKIVHIDYADAAQLKDNVAQFLTEKKEGELIGSVMVDEHNNALILQAMRSDIERIIPLIEQLDRPTPQILIEAHIVETTSDVARELGIQWGGLSYDGHHNWVTSGSNSTGITGHQFSSGGIDPSAGLAGNFPGDLGSIANIPGSGLTLGYIYEDIGNMLLTVQLSALEEDGMLNILSRPSITTLDNKKAIIESGDEVPFQTVEDGEVKIEYKKAVLRLEVTPHVIESEVLKLNIFTSKDEIDFTRTVAGNPTIVTKKAETNVILFNGQTTVIGGLNKETKSSGESGVPGFRDLPIFGHLFKRQGNSDKMEEVLIFITPHILEKHPDREGAATSSATP
jgi:type IV pilus assembly protein PilQ